jgi:hypothetical protein
MADIFEILSNFASQKHVKPNVNTLSGTMARLGRPGWKHAIDDFQSAPNQVHNLALQKMIGGKTLEAFMKSVTREEAVALCSCSFVLHVLPEAVFAEELVASNMAVCLWIDDSVPKSHRVYLSYNIEPFLSEASANLIEMVGLVPILQFIRPLIASQQVTPGPRGEFFTRLLVLTAMRRCMPGDKNIQEGTKMNDAKYSKKNEDFAVEAEFVDEDEQQEQSKNESLDADKLGQATDNPGNEAKFPDLVDDAKAMESDDDLEEPPMNPFHFLQPVRVSTFLSSLFPRDQWKDCLHGQIDDASMVDFLNGVVFFNQGQALVFSNIAPDHFRHFLATGIFVQCSEGHPHFDGLIPVLLANGDITFIGLQSRLYQEGDKKYGHAVADIPQKLYGIDLTQVPSMMIYFSMGYKQARLCALRQNNKKGKTLPGGTLAEGIVATKMLSLFAMGISNTIFPFLSADEASAINDMKFCFLDRDRSGAGLDEKAANFIRRGVLWRSYNGLGFKDKIKDMPDVADQYKLGQNKEWKKRKSSDAASQGTETKKQKKQANTSEGPKVAKKEQKGTLLAKPKSEGRNAQASSTRTRGGMSSQ